MTPKRALALFATGAVLGTLGDRIHTYWGVLDYPRPVLFDEAWWVPLLMGGAGIAMIGGHAQVSRRLGAERPASTAQVVTGLAWFMGAYLASGLFKAYPVTLTLAYVAAFVARALRPPVSRTLWVHAVGTAIIGTLFEAGLSATGAFRYLVPDFLGVPMWLPGLYLHAALAAGAVDRRWPEA